MGNREIPKEFWDVIIEFDEWAQGNTDLIKEVFEEYASCVNDAFKKAQEKHGPSEEFSDFASGCLGDDEPLLRLAKFHDTILEIDEKRTSISKRKPIFDEKYDFQGIRPNITLMYYKDGALNADLFLFEKEGTDQMCFTKGRN